LVSIAVAVVLADTDSVRGYGTFWAGALALVSWYFVIGYFTFSDGWRRDDEGAALLTLALIPTLVMTMAWLSRVFLAPPPNPTLFNAIIYSTCFFAMAWWATILTVRQVTARRELRERA